METEIAKIVVIESAEAVETPFRRKYKCGQAVVEMDGIEGEIEKLTDDRSWKAEVITWSRARLFQQPRRLKSMNRTAVWSYCKP